MGKTEPEVIKALGAFGGGLGGHGEVCGALVGALAVLGLKFSRAREEEKEDRRLWSSAQELYRRFREEVVPNHPGIDCWQIAQVNWQNREEVKNFYQGEKIQECARLVGDTARLLAEILDKF